MNLNSPVTGFAQTGLTSPTFTLVPDTAPMSNGKQFAISALGGTQTGVAANSVGAPFSITYVRPAAFKMADAGILAASGMIANVPKNVHKLITRKAVGVNSEGGKGVLLIETTFSVPVNSPDTDLVSIKSAISAHVGAIQQDGDQWFEGILDGTL